MSLVDELLSSVSFDEGWRLIERFSVLVRESGSLDERAAAHFISTRLKTMGVPQEVHEAEVFISVPRSASVEVGRATLAGKPPSFSASTGEQGLAAEPVHVPADRDRGGSDLFKGVVEGDIPDVRGRIVVTEGYPMPVSVARFEAAGAAGQVYINPGSRVHWGICTPIWGAPTEDQMRHKPATPIIAINRIDGDALLGRMAKGADRITLCTELDEKWISCPLPVARIDGGDEDFVLVHGHYDSWDIGIGDNAVGNATLLELARIFHEHREGLARSVRIAWWPAHSTGRYGGSTWYADNFGVDLYNHCVAAVNIDSPGCRGATAYDEVPWMVEAEDVCRSSIHAVAGIDPGRQRPLRAGDYSFNQLGVSSFFMLLSNIPDEERQRLGFYPVGGCGGNIAWHTEADRLGVADRDNLERDLRVYLAAIGQFVEDEVIPLDYRKTVIELDGQLREYEPKAHKRFDITAIRRGLEALRKRLDKAYREIEKGNLPPKTANDLLRRLGRLLVPLGYSESPRFEHDPATPRVPIPALARIHEFEHLEEHEPHRLPAVKAELRRNANEIVQRLREAVWLLDVMAGTPKKAPARKAKARKARTRKTAATKTKAGKASAKKR